MLACAAPALANSAGDHGHANGNGQQHAQGKAKVHNVTWVFKGTWNAADGTVTVKHGNSFVRKDQLVGTDVQFDLSGTRFVVKDVNKDGARNQADLADGDRVLVKARLPRKDPGSQPFKAKMLIDQTHPPKGGSTH
ncbi:MAG TPA: hypothetical protein VGF74_06965 [Thermoleophilaceae bacterium]